MIVAGLGMLGVCGRYVQLRMAGRLAPHDAKAIQYFPRGSKEFTFDRKLTQGLWAWLWDKEQWIARQIYEAQWVARPLYRLGIKTNKFGEGGLFGQVVTQDIKWKGKFEGPDPELDGYLPDVPATSPWKGRYQIERWDRKTYIKAWADVLPDGWARFRESEMNRYPNDTKLTRFPNGREKLLCYSESSVGRYFKSTYTYDGKRLVIVDESGG
jgi:hypothetical protein